MSDSGLSVSAANQAQPEEAETSISTNSTPVVFQCSQCNCVVGDSTSWMSANKIMRTITLAYVTSKVGVRPNVDISKNGVDKDSTFRTLYCVNCSEEFGKQYLASPPDLDCIRGSFTFLVEKLNSYEIGSAETGGNTDLADILSVPSARYMQQNLKKIHYLIVSMNGRIRALEMALNEDKSDVTKTNGLTQQAPSESIVDDSESVSSSENITDVNQMQQMFHSRNRNTTRDKQPVVQEESSEENVKRGRHSVSNKENRNFERVNLTSYQLNEETQRDQRKSDINKRRSMKGANDGEAIMTRRGDGDMNQYTRMNSQRECSQSQYRQHKEPSVVTEDWTEDSVCDPSEMNEVNAQKSGTSLMEQWPSLQIPKVRSTRKRKLANDN